MLYKRNIACGEKFNFVENGRFCLRGLAEVYTQSEHMGRISVNFPIKWCILKQNVMPRIILINEFVLTNEWASFQL